MTTFRDDREPSPVGRRAMSNGMCIALIVAGAILRFALTARSPHGLNLPLLTRLRRNRQSRPPVPDRRQTYISTPAEENQTGNDSRPVLVKDNRHLVRPTQPDMRYDVES